MEAALAALGAVIVAAILWEVFNDLFHPAGTGALADWLGRHLFNAFKHASRFLPLSGPVTLITTIGIWVAGLVVGFALIYLHSFPADFRTSTGAMPPPGSRFASVLYFSFETLITLGYGDLVPQSAMTRVLSNIEALVGFGLLTASVSSIVLIYPALARMRLLARGVSHLTGAERDVGRAVVACESDVVLNSLARDVTHTRIDLLHFPVVYFFTSNDRNAAIAFWTADLVRFALDAQAPQRPASVRHGGAVLDRALHDLAAILDERFLHTGSGSRERIFEAFARDHLVLETSRSNPRSTASARGS